MNSINPSIHDRKILVEDRQIRVFISSTFRDMMRERDLLVKEVFPELRRKCAKRFVTFTDVDLRWGITEAQANEGQVLPLCLAEIERSRPYFIGMLGERYGWIPDSIRPEVIEREPWLKEHVHGRTSVTELEILHGVLNNPEMQGHAFFYFRHPAYANDPALTDDERRDVVERDIRAEVEEYGPAEATRRTVERKAKLAMLKQRIRDSKLPLVEPYDNPKALAEIVRRQFDELIDRVYPDDQTPDMLAQERMAHEAHAKNKLFACIERLPHLAVLNAFAAPVEHKGQGLVVTGESGGGKTALLAAWARDWAKDHPGDFLFQHYFGATPDSASPEGFLRRLLGELKMSFDITDDIPVDPEKLRDTLPIWLAQASARVASIAPTGGEKAAISVPVRIVLVIDGLNQVHGADPDRRLRFLPRHFPPHVAALTSALPGPALDALRERSWTEHSLPRATEAEVDAMVGEYLNIHARTLEPKLRHELITAPGARNPLFLRTVLEELRQFGSFERLPQRVRHYLEADSVRELFLRVLKRWQEDFDGKTPEVSSLAPTGGEVHGPRPLEQERVAEGQVRAGGEETIPAGEGVALTVPSHLVRRALTDLWAARQGLSEPEWLDLLGPTIGPPNGVSNSAINDGPLPRALWTPLFLALEPHLSQRAGLFAFGHDFLRQAVKAAFVPSSELQQDAHLSVADYFERHAHQREMTPRKAVEWPHQLHAAQAWNRLEACLTDIPLFLALCNVKTKWELTGYWLSLREQGRDMGDCYSKAYARWIALPDNASDHLVPNELGFYLLENGSYVSAEAFLVAALNARAQVEGPEDPSTLVSMNNLATLLWKKGDYAGAELLYRRALEVSERVLGEDDPNMLDPMNNLAVMLDEKGDQAGAEPLCRRALEGCKRILGPEHPRTLLSMNNLAVSLTRKGNYAEAEELCRQALEVSEWVLGPDDPTTLTIAYGLGFLLDQKGDDTEAEPLYRRALEAMERVLGPEHPDTLSTTQAVADFFDKVGKAEEGLSLRLKRIKLLSEDPNAEPLILRTAALDSYRLGNHTLATVFLRRILEAGFELPGTHCHLARVLLLSDEIDTARHEIAQAWQHRADAPPYVLPRILFFQLLFAFLDHADSGTTLNRLKHALAQEGAHMEWMIQPVLEHLRPRLSPGDMALLQAVSAAIDSEKNMDLLEDSGEDEH